MSKANIATFLFRKQFFLHRSPSKHLIPFGSRTFQQDMAISRRQDSTILLGKECNYANQLILGRSSLQQGSPSKHLIPSAPFGPRTLQQGKESPHRLSLNNSIPKDMWRKYMGMPRIRLYGCSAMFQTFPPRMMCKLTVKKTLGGIH